MKKIMSFSIGSDLRIGMEEIKRNSHPQNNKETNARYRLRDPLKKFFRWLRKMKNMALPRISAIFNLTIP